MNKFSSELNTGLVQKKDSSTLSPNLFLNIELGGRYMFNSNNGLKFDIGFIPLKKDFNFNSFEKSFQIRYSAQYVLNFGRLLHFEKFAPRFSGLIHLGGGISNLKYKESLYFKNWKSNLTDETINLILGITPQFKINDRIELHLDFSYNPEIFQDFGRGFQWSDFTQESLFGRKTNISLGGTYYIGKQNTHSDWNFKIIEKEILKDSIPIVKQDSILANVYDTDKDGILDEDDYCPEEFGLKEFQGCPKPELTFDCDLNDFPVFVFNKARHELLSIYDSMIDSIAKCMLENKHKKIIIYGFTDNFGDSIYTEELSFNRAEVIKNAIVLKGISPDRIFALGESRKKAKLPEHEKTITHNRVAFIEAISSNQDDIKVLESGEFLQGLFFTVQIGAYQKVLKNNKFNKLGKVLITKSPDGFIRYSVDVFLNYEDAYEKWKKIRANGAMQDSFITAYFLGEKITIKKAQELLLLKGSDILQK